MKKNKLEENHDNTSFDHTNIAKDIELIGTLKSKNSVTIYGKFEGDIKSNSEVTLKEGSSFTGNINANSIIAEGKVNGVLKAQKKVSVTKTAHLECDIQAERIIMEPGAFFKGKLAMS